MPAIVPQTNSIVTQNTDSQQHRIHQPIVRSTKKFCLMHNRASLSQYNSTQTLNKEGKTLSHETQRIKKTGYIT
jgi:hypothetical protein